MNARWMPLVAGLFLVCGQSSEATSREVLADSFDDWSVIGTQGELGWSSGFYNRSADGDASFATADFTLFLNDGLGVLGPLNHWDGSSWAFAGGTPPAVLSQDLAYPAGVNGGDEHWVIRRWECTEPSNGAMITWRAEHLGACGTGVTAHLFVNGVERDSAVVSTGSPPAVVARNVGVDLTSGDLVDLALSAVGTDSVSSDACDEARLRLTILGPATFRRGDVNGDGEVDIGDAAHITAHLFLGGPGFDCGNAADTDGNSQIQLTDAVRILSAAYLQGLQPPSPFPGCGIDPAGDPLGATLGPCFYPSAACTTPEARPLDPDFSLSFETDASTYQGPAGAAASVDVRVLLAYSVTREVRGWSVAVQPRNPEDPFEVSGAAFAGGSVSQAFAEFSGGFGIVRGPADLPGDSTASAVLLSFTSPTALDPFPNPRELYTFQGQATFPPSGCVPYTFRFGDNADFGGGSQDNFIVDGDRLLGPNLLSYTIQICAELPTLLLDTPVSFTLGPAACTASYKLPTQVEEVFVLTLDDADSSHVNAVYVRWGAFPSPTEFDLASSGAELARHGLVIPFARSGDLNVLVEAIDCAADPHQLTLEAHAVSLAVEGLSVRSASTASEAVHAAVRGGGFSEATTFALESAGGALRINGRNIRVLGSGLAEVEFAVQGAAPGVYDLVAQEAGQIARAAKAFTLKASDLGPRLETQIVMAGTYRVSRVRQLLLRYQNRGDVEMEAPLFRIVGPPQCQFRLPGERDFRGNEIFVLGIDPGGLAGKLPPGGAGEVPVTFLSSYPCGEEVPPDACTALFEVELLTAGRDDSIAWEALPPPDGVAPEAWPGLRTKLALKLGSTWRDYAEALAGLATRLARRGGNASSVDALFRLALREADGKPSAAIIGALRDTAGFPVAGTKVAAVSRGAVEATTGTSSGGVFVLNCLAGGSAYSLRIHGRELASPLSRSLPAGAELSVHDLLSSAAPGVQVQEDIPSCDDAPPPRALTPPASRFTRVAEKRVQIRRSFDPNKKTGNPGQEDDGDSNIVGPDELLEYTIEFENEPAKANAAVQRVGITDDLPVELDVNTVRFTKAGVGRFDPVDVIPTAAETAAYGAASMAPVKPVFAQEPSLYGRGIIDLGRGDGWHVTVDAQRLGARLEWTFVTRDAAGNAVGSDDDQGFLPPNTPAVKPDGEGFVTFQVYPAAELPPTTEVENDADIVFDENSIVPTGPFANQVAGYGQGIEPALPRNPLPGGVEPAFDLASPVLAWERQARDETYEVILWEEGSPEPATPTFSRLDLASVKLSGLKPEARYHWRVVTVNGGSRTPGPEWTFTTSAMSAFVRGDADSSGAVDITDAIFVLSHLFLGARGPSCREAADANGDLTLDISDAVALLGYLFLGQASPPSPAPSTTEYLQASGTADCGFGPLGPNGVQCVAFAPCGG